jgi:ABC-type lipoprotein release transport system permease subunit
LVARGINGFVGAFIGIYYIVGFWYKINTHKQTNNEAGKVPVPTKSRNSVRLNVYLLPSVLRFSKYAVLTAIAILTWSKMYPS